MTVEFCCLSCGKLLRVSDSTLGKKARCPECGGIQHVPTATPSGFDWETDQTAAAATGTTAISGTAHNPFTEGIAASDSDGSSVDSQNPYAASVTKDRLAGSGGAPGPMTLLLVETRVAGPATSLSILAGLALVAVTLGLVLQLAMMWDVGAPSDDQWVELVQAVVAIVVNFVVIFGAIQMKRLKSYPLAVIASVLAMLPCTGCCIFGLPIGIWSLVVLCDPSVREAFR